MVSALSVVFLIIDIPGTIFYILVLIFLITRLLLKDDDFSPKFYCFLIVNAIMELCFIMVEYFIVRLPLFNIFKSQYMNFKSLPGLIYGLSCYLPCVIGSGQLNLTINRLLMIKFPFIYKYIMSIWGILALIFIQFAIPFVQLVRTLHVPMIIRVLDDNYTITVELDDFDLVYSVVSFGVVYLIVTSILCCLIGSYTLFLLWRMNKQSLESTSKSERSLLALVVLQTLTQLFLAIVGTTQFVAGYSGNEAVYAVSLYMYPVAEDLLCLSCPVMLCCVSGLVRKKLFKFYFCEKVEQKFSSISKVSTIKFAVQRQTKMQ
ncbi:7TM GPCR, serpentine receptor class g (Srg) family and 7TM GPCR, serpentine receptor class v (Srv) family-containing protein [Strongyloides ratti]|uniref:Serpentine receptor class gamma n=1 Tax=Strongyloides ratti TaxID=34506 RepID=A0A090MSH9_STRRB|nr:7TM GPCR, serpentine receptor class g (Srg) family and 7TM GPCR, serpentine receptor class v (Srv) family-containing protein [Strongyloides ratti]CEF61193.1 7TM GPCR, serpentine receptor class g (Srg) family and 7TM GPCR, serpentine receptor class v (Srv) family-containing protein [Strongyloides ratti]